jgi:predicted phage tail component-like protein
MRFNGHDLSEYLRINPTRDIMPPYDVVTQDVPGGQGSIYIRTQLNARKIPVSARLALPPMGHRSVALIRHKLESMLMTDGPAPLYLDDEPDIYYMAQLTSPGELTNLWYTGSADLEFTAYDPIAYGADRNKAVSSGGTASFSVGGNSPTWPKFTGTATGAAVQVKNVDTGQLVKTVNAITSGASVTVDMSEASPSVRVNGNLVPVAVTSDYFSLSPGTARVYVYGASGTLSWTERWA